MPVATVFENLEAGATIEDIKECFDVSRNTAAEEAGFDLFLTTDKNIRYQQNLTGRKIAIVVIGNTQWPELRLPVQRVVAPVTAATTGSYSEVDIPAR